MLIKVKELEQSFGIELADDLRTYVLVQLNSANYDLLSSEHLPNLSNNEREFIDSLIKESEENKQYIMNIHFSDSNGVGGNVLTKSFKDKEEISEVELYIDTHYSDKIKAYNNRELNEPFLDIFGFKFHVHEWEYNNITVDYLYTVPLFI